MQKGANPNVQTTSLNTTLAVNFEEEEDAVYLQTPLHLAILGQHEATIQAMLDHKCKKYYILLIMYFEVL